MAIDKASLLSAFAASGKTYGDMITHAEVDSWAGIRKPGVTQFGGTDGQSVADALRDYEALRDQYEFDRLAATEALRDNLLVSRQMYLRNDRGLGYRIVHPSEQTDLAIGAGMKLIKKGLKHAERGVNNINRGLLTPEERAYNSSVSARLNGLKVMLGRKRDLTLPAVEVAE